LGKWKERKKWERSEVKKRAWEKERKESMGEK
jgi:hypothetical protein